MDACVVHASKDLKQSAQKVLTLEDCLSHFSKSEELEGDDKAYCSTCKEFQEATKRIEIWRRPDTLMVHLRRFHVSRGFFSREKIDATVEYPIESLDLEPFIKGPDSQDSQYQLVAVVKHMGGMGGGHYTALGRHPEGGWYEFNDSNASPISDDQVQTDYAYCLFYQRHGTTDRVPLPAITVQARTLVTEAEGIKESGGGSTADTTTTTTTTTSISRSSSSTGGIDKTISTTIVESKNTFAPVSQERRLETVVDDNTTTAGWDFPISDDSKEGVGSTT
eukprot:UC1_evm1s1817